MVAHAEYVIFYDDACDICRRSRQAVERMRPTAAIRFIDSNDVRAVGEFPQMANADRQGQMYVLDPAGRLSGGYDAMVSLAGALPLVAWLTPVLRLGPVRAVGRRVYRWVASNRYRLGGQTPCHAGACAVNPSGGSRP